MSTIDVLISTFGRKTGLAVVLTSLMGQTYRDFDVIIADQTPLEASYLDDVEIKTVVEALRWRGHDVRLYARPERRGLAEQRQFLLDKSTALYVQYLDDDVLLEPAVLERMLGVIETERCGFVGCPATGPSYLDDVRPAQQKIEVWTGPVRPEPFAPGDLPWERHLINNAANPLHLEQKLVHDPYSPREAVRYKVAWVGGANILYDRAKLDAVGGFSWWSRLPPEHAGEDALAQFLLIRAYGGCGVLPAGTYHLGLPTTVEDRRVNAIELFGDLIEERGL